MGLPTREQIARMEAGKKFRVASACPSCRVRGRMDIQVMVPGENFRLQYFCGNCQDCGSATPQRPDPGGRVPAPAH